MAIPGSYFDINGVAIYTTGTGSTEPPDQGVREAPIAGYSKPAI